MSLCRFNIIWNLLKKHFFFRYFLNDIFNLARNRVEDVPLNNSWSCHRSVHCLIIEVKELIEFIYFDCFYRLHLWQVLQFQLFAY